MCVPKQSNQGSLFVWREVSVKVFDLQQNSEAWFEWRQSGLGASDAPILLGVSPWKTPEELREEKMRPPSRSPGGGKKGSNRAQQWGHDNEPDARGWYTDLTGIGVVQVCCCHDDYPWIKASLDGLNTAIGRVVEIKAPYSQSHGTHDLALAGEVPHYYLPQLIHQSLVTGLDRVDYVSYDPRRTGPDRLAIVPVTVTQRQRDILLEAEKEFWASLSA